MKVLQYCIKSCWYGIINSSNSSKQFSLVIAFFVRYRVYQGKSGQGDVPFNGTEQACNINLANLQTSTTSIKLQTLLIIFKKWQLQTSHGTSKTNMTEATRCEAFVGMLEMFRLVHMSL